MNEAVRRRAAVVRMFSSAVSSQVLLSAASFAIGLILIRGTTDAQYGYFILASNAMLLLVSLQRGFFNPTIALQLHALDTAHRGALVGGLRREQVRILAVLGSLAVAVGAVLCKTGILDPGTAAIALMTIAASLAMLQREFFRMVLFALRRPQDVLRTDLLYALLLVPGAALAILSTLPAVAALVATGLAALASGALLTRRLAREQPMDRTGLPGLLRRIAAPAAWSTSGAAIHWTFSQGYMYLVAGTLDVSAVATIAATRLLVMPMNLLSTGIGSLMLPLASGWLQYHGATRLWRRLCMLAAGMAAATLCYLALLWWLRDWVFATVLRRQFAQGDLLLLLWGAIALTSVVRDQLAYRLAAEGRFRSLTLLTALSAVFSLCASYLGMLQYGVIGALLGMLLGELINVIGVVLMSLRDSIRCAPSAPAQSVTN